MAFGTIVSLTCVAGVVSGVGLSLQRQRALDEQVERLLEEEAAPVAAPTVKPRPGLARDFMAADPASLEGIPPYPGAAPRRLAASPVFSGAPLLASWFTTSDSVEQVVEYYRQAFAPFQRPQVVRLLSPSLGYAAFYEFPGADAGDDVLSGRLHLVTGVRSGPRTYVFLSNTQPSRFLEQAAVLPGGLSLPEGALRGQWVEVGELPGQRRTLFTVVPATSAAAVAAHFQRDFEQNGWTAGPAEQAAEAVTLEARREADSVVVVIKSEPEGDAQLLLTFERQATTADQGNP